MLLRRDITYSLAAGLRAGLPARRLLRGQSAVAVTSSLCRAVTRTFPRQSLNSVELGISNRGGNVRLYVRARNLGETLL